METELKRNLIESVNLENCLVSVFPKMIKDKDRSFYKHIRPMVRENCDRVAREIIYETTITLLKEILVILNQLWKVNPNRIDESLINQRRLYNLIKDKISKDGKPLPFNTKELFKRIREAIAHNSAEKQNFVYNLENFEMNLGQVDGNDYIVELTPEEVSTLVVVLASNLKESPTHAICFHDCEILTREDVSQHMGIKNIKTSEEKNFDRNQIERIYAYFRYVAKDKTIEGNAEKINKVIALPENPETLLSDKIAAVKVVRSMTTSSTWNDILQNNDKMGDTLEFVSVYFALVSNMLFGLVASQTNAEIKNMFLGTGVNLSDEEIRHLRNSLCHGRYFHDFDRAFYFYDGKKELTYGVKLTINDINKLLDKIAIGKHSVAVLKQ